MLASGRRRSVQLAKAAAKPVASFAESFSIPEGPLPALERSFRLQGLKPNASQFTAAAALQQVYVGHHRGERTSGIYLFGPVGVGKTTVADFLFRSLPAAVYLHYDELVHTLHRQLHSHRRKVGSRSKTGMQWIHYLARKMVRGKLLGPVSFLFVDEMQLPTVQDCTLVIPFLSELRARGCTIIATSNKAPTELFRVQGLYPALQRQLQALVDDLEACEVDGPDYRQLAGATNPADPPVVIIGHGRDILAGWERRLSPASGGPQADAPIQLPFGRSLNLSSGRMMTLNFQEDFMRFGVSYSAADFHTLAAHLDVLILEGVPKFERASYDAARRLSMLVEALYEQRALLVCTLAVAAPEVFEVFMRRQYTPKEQGGSIGGSSGSADAADGVFVRRSCSEHRCGGCTWSSFGGKRCGVVETEDWGLLETRFAAERAVSRLAEMSSARYVAGSKAFRHSGASA